MLLTSHALIDECDRPPVGRPVTRDLDADPAEQRLRVGGAVDRHDEEIRWRVDGARKHEAAILRPASGDGIDRFARHARRDAGGEIDQIQVPSFRLVVPDLCRDLRSIWR